MAKMPKATVFVGFPKESPSGDRFMIKFEHSDEQTQLARDIVNSLREKGWDVKGVIEVETKLEI